MIQHLSGDFETVEYSNNGFILLYDNTENEDYPMHWHNALEIIMPLVNSFSVTVGSETYNLKERELIIIPPGELHSMSAPGNGQRIIFQCDSAVLNDFPAMRPIASVFSDITVIDSHSEERIKTGIKLSKIIPDDVIEEYINSYFMPYLKDEDWNSGIKNGYSSFYKLLCNYYEIDSSPMTVYNGLSFIKKYKYSIFMIILFICSFISNKLGTYHFNIKKGKITQTFKTDFISNESDKLWIIVKPIPALSRSGLEVKCGVNANFKSAIPFPKSDMIIFKFLSSMEHLM